MSNCSSLEESDKNKPQYVMSISGVVSVICCVLALGLVFYLKLHKHFLYRLAMYQVLSSMLVSLNAVLAIILNREVWWSNQKYNETFDAMCEAIAFLLLYFDWIKLLFTTMLSFHLFCLAVCLKDFKYYEKEYIVISVCLPALFVWIPFIKHKFGPVGPWCWIKNPNNKWNAGLAEQIFLWYVPCIVLLLFCTIAAVAVIVVLWYRHNSNNNSNEREALLNQASDKNMNALIEITPLLIYPTVYIILQIITAIVHIYIAICKQLYFGSIITNSVIDGSWGIFSSMALFFHIMISKYLKRRKKNLNLESDKNFTELHVRTGKDRLQIFTSYTEVTTDARSCYNIPTESEVENETGARNEAEAKRIQ